VELVELDESRELNITRIFKGIRKASSQPEGDSLSTEETSPPQISIKMARARNGTIKLVDRSIKPPFHAVLSGIDTTVKGLSNLPGTKADLSIKAVINNNAGMSIKGTVNPMVDPRFVPTWKSRSTM